MPSAPLPLCHFLIQIYIFRKVSTTDSSNYSFSHLVVATTRKAHTHTHTHTHTDTHRQVKWCHYHVMFSKINQAPYVGTLFLKILIFYIFLISPLPLFPQRPPQFLIPLNCLLYFFLLKIQYITLFQTSQGK